MHILGLASGLVIGFSLGLLGGGGSILTVPVFVYVLGFDAKEAIAMSLAVVGATSLFAAARHWRAGYVHGRIALVFGGAGMVGTWVGTQLSVFFTGSAQLALFAVVMLSAAVFMLRASPASSTSRVLQPAGADTGHGSAATAAQGAAVGILTGLIGVGGGFLIVPALVLLGGVSMRHAVGTSLLVIAMNSSVGLAGYLTQVQVPWLFALLFTAMTVPGSLLGAQLMRFVPIPALRRAFAALLVVVGVFILVQNRGALFAAVAAAGAR